MFRYLKLSLLFARVSVQNDTAYRGDFFSNLFMAMAHLAGEIVGLWTIFSNTRSLAGWNVFQVLALIGVFRIMVGFIGFCVAPNMRMIMQDIREGRLDFVLLKPINSQFYVSTRRVVIWRVTDLAIGFGMVTIACLKLSANLTPAMVLTFLVMLTAGAVIIYSFWLVLATCAIWFTRLSNIEMVFWNMFEAGRYPVDIYPYWLRIGLTYVIPLAFLTTFPVAALVGKTHLPGMAVTIPLAIASFVFASFFWRFGLRCYSGASA